MHAPSISVAFAQALAEVFWAVVERHGAMAKLAAVTGTFYWGGHADWPIYVSFDVVTQVGPPEKKK